MPIVSPADRSKFTPSTMVFLRPAMRLSTRRSRTRRSTACDRGASRGTLSAGTSASRKLFISKVADEVHARRCQHDHEARYERSERIDEEVRASIGEHPSPIGRVGADAEAEEESALSDTNAKAKCRKTVATTMGRVFGRICRITICHGSTRRLRAAST